MRSQVLQLYKDLLKYGANLRFTDKQYYRYRIRRGFRQNKDLEDQEAIQFQIEKGKKVLEHKKII